MSKTIELSAMLQRTPLYALHCELGARMAPFAGYEMPMHYRSGVLREHLLTRRTAGLFDISHMGQIVLRPRKGDVVALARALERLVPVDVVGLAPTRQRYAFFTNTQGGIIDDLIIGHRGDHLLLVVNASRKTVDEQLVRSALSDVCAIEPLTNRALLAVQGPAAETVLARFAGPVAAMRFMENAEFVLAGCRCLVARSGYAGEDGFEISVAADKAQALARALLEQQEIGLAGFGARDSLRIEAGLCLYGTDIDETTTPVEAALEWVISKVRRHNGDRAGNFLGAERILSELEYGARRRRIGLRPQDRVPVRRDALLFADASRSEPIGVVTSGLYGPSVGAPVAIGYVVAEYARPGTQLFAQVRGNRVPVVVTTLPFVPHRYKRTQ